MPYALAERLSPTAVCRRPKRTASASRPAAIAAANSTVTPPSTQSGSDQQRRRQDRQRRPALPVPAQAGLDPVGANDRTGHEEEGIEADPARLDAERTGGEPERAPDQHPRRQIDQGGE